MCAVKSQPGKPECPRTAQHRSYICWLATLRNMHDTRLTPPTTASTRLQVCLFWDKISQPNYHKTVTNRQFFLARFARETAGPDRPPARNSGVRPKKCPPEILLKHGPVGPIATCWVMLRCASAFTVNARLVDSFFTPGGSKERVQSFPEHIWMLKNSKAVGSSGRPKSLVSMLMHGLRTNRISMAHGCMHR